MAKNTALLLLIFIFHGNIKAFSQSSELIDTVLAKATGAFFDNGLDTVRVLFKGEDLNAKLIFSFHVESKKDSVVLKACIFPDSKSYFSTIRGCLNHTLEQAKLFEGYFTIEEFKRRRYFSGYPQKYAYDDMKDIEIKKGVFASWHLSERIKAGLRNSELTDELLNKIILEIYQTRNTRNQITLFGPYEYINTFVWSNILDKAVETDSPYGL